MRVAPILIVIVSSLFLVNCARSPEALTQRRIAGVEQGLLSDYSDPPWMRMELLERMQHYRVPGVTIAVINEFQIEWIKEYGVLEAGSSEPVAPETLFQTASLAKPIVAMALIGWLFAIWSIVDQLTRGRGTPLPVMATQTLLITGPFAYCRNPMSFGTIVLYYGLAIWTGSWSAIVLVTSFAAVLIAYLKYIEEKELEARFGQSYMEYKKTTPFIIPSMSKK